MTSRISTPRVLYVLALVVGAVGVFYGVKSFFAATPGNGVKSLVAAVCVMVLMQLRREYLKRITSRDACPESPGV
jgi:uncharacterized membrane protein YsdA (DUF1294 family)